MEGLGITACSLRMPGACLNHVHGWTIWGGYGTLPQTAEASDRSQVARRRVRLDLVTSGLAEQQPTSNRTSLAPAFAQL